MHVCAYWLLYLVRSLLPQGKTIDKWLHMAGADVLRTCGGRTPRNPFPPPGIRGVGSVRAV